VAGRQAFWVNLFERLSHLSNRIGADDQTKIRNAVHARIPMVMPDEADVDEATYWETYSKLFMEHGADERERAAEAIACAQANEGVAAIFAANRAAALAGQRPMKRGVVGEVLASRAGGRPINPERRRQAREKLAKIGIGADLD
jgi:hypothetical protein